MIDRPVVIIGLMGAGKSKIGAMLAHALRLPFHDADSEIERRAGMTIARIFETDGEPAFRALERAVIQDLLGRGVAVIAPGGGALTSPETARLVAAQSVAVWLRAELDVLVERTARNADRPLLKTGNPRDILARLIEERSPVYEAVAALTVDSGDVPAEQTLARVIERLDDYFSKKE